MDLPNSRVWAVTPMDCIALIVGAEQSTNATIKEPNRNYSKNACKERDFVGVTKKHGNKVFSA